MINIEEINSIKEEIKQGIGMTIPVPLNPTIDLFGRIFESSNDKPGRVRRFIERTAENHPHVPTAEKQKTSLTFDIIESKKRLEVKIHVNSAIKKDAKGKPIGLRAISFSIEKEDLLDGECVPCPKVFQLLLSKVAQSCFSLKENRLVNEVLTITDRELVELGIFNSTDSARKHLNRCLSRIHTLLIKCRRTDGVEYRSLITGWKHLRGGVWRLTLNQMSYWDLFLGLYADFPVEGFSLTNKAFQLLRYVLLQARVRRSSLKEGGGFKISVHSVIERLQLDKTQPHIGRYVVDPLKTAIQEINNLHCGINLKYDDVKGQAFIDSLIWIQLEGNLLQSYKPKKEITSDKKGVKHAHKLD